MKEYITRIFKNAGILLAGSSIANILILLSVSIFTRSVGAYLYGVYAVSFSAIAIINGIFNIQSWQAFIKFSPEEIQKGKKERVLIILIYCFILDILSMIVAFLISIFFGYLILSFVNIEPTYIKLFKILSITILFNAANVSDGVFRIFNEFKVQSKIIVFKELIKFVIFAIILFVNNTFSNFILAIVFVSFFNMLMQIYFALKILSKNNIKFNWIFKNYQMNQEIKSIKRIFRFMFYTNFNVSVRMVSRQLGNILIGKLLSVELAGINKIALTISNLIAKLTSPLYISIFPEFTKLVAKKENKKTLRISKTIIRYLFVFVICMFTGFAVIGKQAIIIAFGIEFSKAYYVTLVYLVSTVIALITLPFAPLLTASGCEKEAFFNQLFSTIIYCIVIYPLIIKFGIFGAPLSYMVFYIFWSLFTIYTMFKNSMINSNSIKSFLFLNK